MLIPEPKGYFSVQAETTINAPVSQVWAVLTDLENYGEWNSFVPVMRSTLALGDLLTMRVQITPRWRVTVKETISAIEPMHMLAWKTRSPGWLLRGERFQALSELEDGTTRYWTREAFNGVLAPLLKFLLQKDLERGFNAVARDLKAQCHSKFSKV